MQSEKSTLQDEIDTLGRREDDAGKQGEHPEGMVYSLEEDLANAKR